jgi:hypothetical protein
MANCGSCRPKSVPSPTPELFQIRHGYRTRWNDLAFSVENNCGDWTLRVQDPARSATLYTAHRGGVRAAQVAALEFAIFFVLGAASRVSPDRLNQELAWQEYW